MGRARSRAQLDRLVAVVGTTPLRDAEDARVWTSRLRALPGDEPGELAKALLRAYRHGALDAARWAALTGTAPDRRDTIDRGIRWLWDAFVHDGLAHVRAIDGGNDTPTMIRRWAWQPRWILMSQDEDLLLMRDDLMPALFAILEEPDVPKRDYVLSIIEHHARDRAAMAARNGAGLDEALALAASLRPAAERVGSPRLASYLARLAAYREAGPVDHAGALQRLRDLARCSEPSVDEVALESVAGGFVGTLKHSGGDRRLRIDARTGAITLEG